MAIGWSNHICFVDGAGAMKRKGLRVCGGGLWIRGNLLTYEATLVPKNVSQIDFQNFGGRDGSLKAVLGSGLN